MANQLKKFSYTVRTPEQLARPAIPYRPATPGRWVTEVARVCSYETVGAVPPLSSVTIPSGAAGATVQYTTAVPGSRIEVCRDVVTTRWVPAQPEQPYVPPVSYRPPSVSTDFNLGWNSGARSIESLTGSGELRFSVPTTVLGVAIGLNDRNQGTGYTEIKHGMLFSRGSYRVIENGMQVAQGSFSATDALKIKRAGRTVTYWVGGAPVYTSAVLSIGPMFMDASLYSGGDEINSPEILAMTGESATSAASFQPMDGLAGVGAYSMSRAAMRPLEGASFPANRAENSLLPLGGLAADRPYAEAKAVMRQMDGTASSGEFMPSFALSSAMMHPPLGFATGLTGTIATSEVVMFPLQGLSADRPYAESRASMLAPNAFAADRAYMQPPQSLPRATLAARGGAAGRLIAPSSRLTASARVLRPDQFIGVAPAATLTAATGAQGVLVAAAATLQAVGDMERVGRAILQGPMLVLEASGRLGTIGAAVLRGPAPTLDVRAGSSAAVFMGPVLRMEGVGSVGATARAQLRGPAARVDARGTSWLIGRAELRAPAMVPAPYGSAALTGPIPRLRASGSILLAVVYEAYAVNLKTNSEAGGNEVTRYTDFPFTQIVRFGSHHYGVAPDGLYRLGGELDNGQPVRFDVQTSTMDFEADTRKTPVSCYLGGRIGSQSTFSVHTGEQQTDRYDYTTPRGPAAQNHRQKFGRGLTARYYSFGLEGDGALELDDMTFEVLNRTRRL